MQFPLKLKKKKLARFIDLDKHCQNTSEKKRIKLDYSHYPVLRITILHYIKSTLISVVSASE